MRTSDVAGFASAKVWRDKRDLRDGRGDNGDGWDIRQSRRSKGIRFPKKHKGGPSRVVRGRSSFGTPLQGGLERAYCFGNDISRFAW